MPDTFALTLPVTIRPITEADLPLLDWFGSRGAFRKGRRATFARHCAGEVVFLVAEANGFPVASLWVELTEKRDQGVGELRALAVLPSLQRLGLGTKLITAGEGVLREYGFATAEIGVGKDNPGARRLYERLGYAIMGDALDEYDYEAPDGRTLHVTDEIFVLQKSLKESP